jgi:hypothetical protein
MERRYRLKSTGNGSFGIRQSYTCAAILVLVAASAWGQAIGPMTANDSLKYQISATITNYCPVEKTVNLHPLLFDFHNNSCQESRHVSELKTPTLPQGPLYRNVRIAGYHFIDWSDGHSSPNSRSEAKIEISKTAATITASGSLGKASCSQGASGKTVVEETFWQASIVPEVTLLEDEQQQPLPVTVEVIPPQTTANLTFSSTCSSEREPSVQYSVTAFVNGLAQSAIYTSPLLTASKPAAEKDATLGSLGMGSAVIHANWSPQTSGNSGLAITISTVGNQEPANPPAP